MKTYSTSNPKQNHKPKYKLNMSPLNVFIRLLYLAVVSLGANFSVHVLLVQRWRDAKTVAHAKTLHSPLRVADLHCSVQDNIPVVELQIKKPTHHTSLIRTGFTAKTDAGLWIFLLLTIHGWSIMYIHLILFCSRTFWHVGWRVRGSISGRPPLVLLCFTL